MAKRKTAPSPLKPWDYDKPVIQPFAKSLEGQPPFKPNLAFLREQRCTEQFERLERLLADAQAIERFAPIEKPQWDPPEIEDKITDLDLARCLLMQTHEPRLEVEDWDESRVWREMYLREYEVSDRLRQIAQNLDDKFDEAITGVDDHNNMLDALNYAARQLELDL